MSDATKTIKTHSATRTKRMLVIQKDRHKEKPHSMRAAISVHSTTKKKKGGGKEKLNEYANRKKSKDRPQRSVDEKKKSQMIKIETRSRREAIAKT